MGIINPTLSFQVENIAAVPVKEPSDEEQKRIGELIKMNVSITKEIYDQKETSWNFLTSPLLISEVPLDKSFHDWFIKMEEDYIQILHNEEELNQIYIDIYKLQDVLTPSVNFKDITILQDEIDREILETLEPAYRQEGGNAIGLPIKKDIVIQQLISYAIGCMMGRYRLDKPGLHIAHPNPTAEEICTYDYNGSEFSIDDDGIIPLMGSRCTFSDDALIRFKNFVEAVWGPDTLTENINFAEECLNKDIEKYLVNDFWGNHCKMYSKRPIYWLFSSKKGAFQVLVYMHRLNKFTPERIRSNYLLKHIQNLENQLQLMSSNETLLTRQEQKRREQIQKDLIECREYDMILKDVSEKQIEIDLDNGVVENYKLFEGVVAKIK